MIRRGMLFAVTHPLTTGCGLAMGMIIGFFGYLAFGGLL